MGSLCKGAEGRLKPLPLGTLLNEQRGDFSPLYKALATHKSIKMEQQTIYWIGPSNPSSYDLFVHEFFHRGTHCPSLFYAARNVLVSTPKDISVEQTHAQYVKSFSDPVIATIALMCAFGTYAFKHHDKVKAVLRNIPGNAEIYVEGTNVNHSTRLYSIEDMRDEAHKM